MNPLVAGVVGACVPVVIVTVARWAASHRPAAGAALMLGTMLFGPTGPASATVNRWDGRVYEDWDSCVDDHVWLDNESARLYTWSKAVHLTQDSPDPDKCWHEVVTGSPGEVQNRADVYIWDSYTRQWKLCYAGDWQLSTPPRGLAYSSYYWGFAPCGTGYYVLDAAAYAWTSNENAGQAQYAWWGGWRNTAYMYIDS